MVSREKVADGGWKVVNSGQRWWVWGEWWMAGVIREKEKMGGFGWEWWIMGLGIRRL